MHGVGVLLDRARFAQVGQPRPVVLPVFRRAIDLGQRHHRDLQLAGQELEPARDLRHLLLPAVAAVVRIDELQVVDDHEPDVVPRS